ncbi:hypothetical protein [Cellulosimicrobium sp. Marseille-Q4280]|uniref:hypothetical protein n=1 Tax=Cellulosimicrobium sp. Marseille-Q4280 TaxID=2937992 RepID=UPI00203B9A8B|nr:hypothetical protein [Cellulosimicrobium sp. Marseille-Q4280]
MLSRTQLDEQARQAASEAVAGATSERDARRLIAVVVSSSPVLVEVASGFARNEQEREDLADSLRAALVDLVLSEDRAFFDLRTAASSSLSGWIRQTAQTFARRDPTVRPRGTVVTPVSFGPEVDPELEAAAQSFPAADAGVGVVDHEHLIEASVAALDAGERKRHMADRPWLAATAMRRLLRLPRVCVPPVPADRAWAREALRADTTLAARSLRAMLDLTAGFGTPGALDERVLSLWDDFSLEEMAALADYPDTTAYVIALGQLTLAPKPSRVAMRQMRKALKDRVGPSAAWSTLSATLLGSFVSRVAEHVSSYDANSDEVSRLAMAAEADRLAAMWPDLVAQVVAWPGRPLGAEESDVEHCLWELFLDVTAPGTAK